MPIHLIFADTLETATTAVDTKMLSDVRARALLDSGCATQPSRCPKAYGVLCTGLSSGPFVRLGGCWCG